MKKRFLKVALLGAMAFTLPVSFYSCKDYDEDIEGLRQENSKFEKQVSDLQSALEATKGELEAAKKSAADALKMAEEAQQAAKDAAAKGDAAMAEAEQAKAEALAAKALAEEAKAAAAKAKEEAIAEAIAECKRLMESTASKEELEEAVSALNGKIEGIQSGLSTLEGSVENINQQISDLNKWKTTVDTQLKALEEYKAAVDQLKSDVSGMKETIEAIQGTIKDLEDLINSKATPADVEAAINELDTEIRKVMDEKFAALEGEIDSINEQIEAIQNNMNTVKDVLTFRLTSLSLIPTLYVDGIPTVEFKSLSYVPKQQGGPTGLQDVPNAKANNISNDATVLKYHVSPSKITNDYIAKADFVHTKAVTRAGEPVNGLIEVAKFNIEDGIMTVNARKTTTESFELTGNQIYTVALKATLGEKCLTEAEKGQEVAVYSEYTRLAETTGTPKIAALVKGQFDGKDHHSDSTEIYKSAVDKLITAPVYYDGSIDIASLVTGCYERPDGYYTKHIEMTKEELAGYGLEFRYAVATGEYILGSNNTNQQAFAKMEGSVLSSKLPDGTTDNRAAIGKTPIVRVSLVDVKNNKLVDQRYLKVIFTEEEAIVNPVDLGEIWVEEANLACNDFTFNFTWEQMTNLVYGNEKLGEHGMSKEDFHRLYTVFKKLEGTGNVVDHSDDPNAGTYALTWTLTQDEVGKILPNESKEVTIKMAYSDPTGLRGDVIFSAKATISIKDLPTIFGYYEQYWQTVGEVYRLTPVHYDPKGSQGQQCKYENNLLNGFTFTNEGYLLNNLTAPCRTWEMQFAAQGQPAGFAPVYSGDYDATQGAKVINGYKLATNGRVAAYIDYSANHKSWTNKTEKSIVFNLREDGKGLVGQDVTLKVWAKLGSNMSNIYNVLTYKVHIVEPLTINASLNGEFYDRVIGGSKISCATAFTMTDFNNYIVSEQTPANPSEKEQYAAELYKYYGVQTPVWNVQEARIAMKKQGGSIVVDDNLNYQESMPLNAAYANASVKVEGTNLVFYNNSGSIVEKACWIYVPVTVKHLWGEKTEYVKIRLNPAK